MDVYRFSISWSRVLPTGDINNINKKGVEYYDKLINKLLENNIQPMVTMYHFDLPLALQAIGGFTSSTIVDYFEAYANLLFEHFGDRVKLWTTFNEPAGCCGGYAGGGPPMVNFPGIGDYACGHNILKSHAAAYHLYKNSYYDRFKGQVGIVLDSFFFYSDKNDSLAAELGLQFMVCQYCVLFCQNNTAAIALFTIIKTILLLIYYLLCNSLAVLRIQFSAQMEIIQTYLLSVSEITVNMKVD